MSQTAFVCLIVLAAGLSAQQGPDPEKIARLLEQGRVSETQDAAAALQLYRSAYRLAKSQGAAEAQTEAALGAGRMIESVSKGARDKLAEAVGLYAEAAAIGTPAQRRIAFNNLGALQLVLGQNTQALDSFGKIEFAEDDPNPAATVLFRYNYGQALQRNGLPDQAYQQYLTALQSDPSFADAIRAAAAVASSPQQAENLCASVLANAAAQARECVHSALPRFASQSGADALLPVLVRSYTLSKLDRNAFDRTESPLFDQLAPKAAPELLQPLKEIRWAYQDVPQPVWDPPAAKALFPWWSRQEPDRATFSALLIMLADADQKSGRFADAMGRYAAAWGTAPGSLDAAVGFLTAMNQHTDTGKARQSLDRIVIELFPAGVLAAGDAGLPSLFRLHMGLGEALFRAGGCQAKLDANNPQGPIFHWFQAAAVEEKLRGSDPSLPRSFPLYKRLAGCVQRSDRETYRKYQAEGFRSYRPVYTASDLLRYHFRAALYPAAWLRVGAQAGLDQWLDSPHPWGQGAEGYGRRFASAAGARFIRQALAFGLDTTLHEEPHFLRMGNSGVKARIGSVFRQTLVCYNSSGTYTFSFWRVGSAYGSAFISNTWRPHGFDNVGDGLVRGSLGLLGDTGTNALKEFLPDFKRVKGLGWVSRLVTLFVLH